MYIPKGSRPETSYYKWNREGTIGHISALDMATTLLCSSTIIFGDKTERHYPKETSKLIESLWIDEEQEKSGEALELPQIGKTVENKTRSIYSGIIFKIEGDDLRLRARAYPGHDPADFDDYMVGIKCKYPLGIMRLRIENARERFEIYKSLMDIIMNARGAHNVR